jgi:hypothetical protein
MSDLCDSIDVTTQQTQELIFRMACRFGVPLAKKWATATTLGALSALAAGGVTTRNVGGALVVGVVGFAVGALIDKLAAPVCAPYTRGAGMTPEQLRYIFEISQAHASDLAKAMNVAPNTVHRWEKGENPPTGLQDEVLRALHNVALR